MIILYVYSLYVVSFIENYSCVYRNLVLLNTNFMQLFNTLMSYKNIKLIVNE